MTDTALTVQPALEPMQMIQAALTKAIESGGADALAVADRILEHQKWMMQHREEEAFNAALRRIQNKLKPIAKMGWNPDTKSKFATSESIDRQIQDLLQVEAMTLSFEPESHPLPEMVRIVGVLSLGAYSRRYPLDMPADGKGAKGGGVMSRTHATGSAITYGKRYLKNMIFDLRFKESDDDGNAAADGQPRGVLEDKDFLALMENIENAAARGELNKFYIAAIKAAGRLGDQNAIQAFEDAANKRIKEL